MVEIDIEYLPHVLNRVINDYVGSPEVRIYTNKDGGQIKFPLIYALFWVKGTSPVQIKNVRFFSDPEQALWYAMRNPINKCYTYIVPVSGSSLTLPPESKWIILENNNMIE